MCLPAENMELSRFGGDGQGPPQTRAQDYLRSLSVRLALIARGSCDHRHAETGYRPSRRLRHYREALAPGQR